MATNNQIGAIKFLSLSPPPALYKKMLLKESRAGINGYAVWFEAERGEPTVVNTVAETDDYERDRVAYNNLIGFVLPVIYDGVAVPGTFLVDHVSTIKRPLLFGRQVNSPAEPVAMIHAQWLLLEH